MKNTRYAASATLPIVRANAPKGTMGLAAMRISIVPSALDGNENRSEP